MEEGIVKQARPPNIHNHHHENKTGRWHGGKESAKTRQCSRARDSGSMPGSGRSRRGGNGNPLQYSCLKNHMDRGAWWSYKELDTELTEHQVQNEVKKNGWDEGSKQ